MARLAAALVLLAAALVAEPPDVPAETADAAFARKDFRRALELYRGELRTGPDAEKERRVVTCLAALQEWDEALREGEALVGRSGTDLDGIKSRRLLAGMLRDAPHWGFRSGGVLRRGGEEVNEIWDHQTLINMEDLMILYGNCLRSAR